MTNAMTKGNSLKLILTFALPLLFGNIFQQTYNIIDSAIVGKTLGPSALAGVGASSSIQFLVIGFCLGFSAGCSVPVAQRFGAKKYSDMRNYVFHGALVTAGIAVLVTLLTTLLCSHILHILATPKDIFEDAYNYLFIIFLGIPFILLYNFLAGVMRAVGDSKSPFIALVISTVLNIILDLFFIIVLHMGCRGAALATILSQGVSGVLCLIHIVRKVDILRFDKKDLVMMPKRIAHIIGFGAPMGLQFSITAIGSMVMQNANNSLGSVYIAAFTSGMRIKMFVMCPFDALATAVGTFVGQNYGAGLMERVKDGIKKSALVGVLYGLFAGLILILFGRSLSQIFISGEHKDILDAAGKYLRCLGYFYWSLGILNVFRMALQALGHTGKAMISGGVEMLARIVVSRVFVPMFGFSAICFADQSAWVSAAIYTSILIYFFFYKKYRSNQKG